MATIAEILKMSAEERREKYSVSGLSSFGATRIGIETVIIDGNKFTDYGAFSFLWEKSYVKSPERSSDGTIGNLDSYATFVTPHLKIDFSMLSIDSYRVLMGDLVYKKNEFLVSCYDVVYNQCTTQKMYFATEEMPKLWTIARALNGEEWVELLGVQDYTVELIGTNASIDTVTIRYYDADGNLISAATDYVDKGTQAIINYEYAPPSGKRFDGWWKTSNEQGAVVGKYKNGDAVELIQDLSLYPVLAETDEYALSFDFGIGIAPIQSIGAKPVTSIPIRKGQTIANAVAEENIQIATGVFTFPEYGTDVEDVTYEFDGEEKSVSGNVAYNFKGWYWTSKANEQTKVTGATVFESDLNRTIYQIYEPAQFDVLYNTGTPELILSGRSFSYNESIILPPLARAGYKFKGWVLGSGKPVPSVMPPEDIIVFASWEKLE